jgi:mono/diheme cytochrome c family protein
MRSAVLIAILLFGVVSVSARADEPVDFARDVMPIFAANCHRCHGPEKQEGGLKLHRGADALRGGDSGAAITPGQSAESILYQYVSGTGDNVMPPEGDGEPLTEPQVALIARWIDQGAPWPAEADVQAKSKGESHWAYQKPVRPELPKVSQPGWCRNEIDRFVLARLDAEGMTPSPEADKARLLRRVSLDLTGLPPTLSEIDAFVADESPDAFEKVVDRLLASPAYGERWARPWLDLARYADTQGYEKDNRRSIWRYRDWVIDAFNRNLPFDQFTIEQLAGDLLPNATLEQRIATGLHRNTMTNTEGGTDNEEFRFEAVVDRVNTTMTIWQGSTFMCCQCHTHKYDPFTQRDYWQLYAFLNSTADADADDDAPYVEAPTPEISARIATMQSEIAILETALNTETPATQAAFENWENLQRAALAAWRPLHVTATAESGNTLTPQEDQSLLVTGTAPDKDVYTLTAPLPGERISALRLEVMPDATLPSNGPGRADNGNFVIHEFRVELITNKDAAPRTLTFAKTAANYSQDERQFPAVYLTDGDAKTGWAIGNGTGKAHEVVFTLAEPFTPSPEAQLRITLEQFNGDEHVLGRFRVSAGDVPDPASVTPFGTESHGLLQKPAAERTPEEQTQIRELFRRLAPHFESIRDRLATLRREMPKPPTTLVLEELKEPRETFIHVRGAYLTKGEQVHAAPPEVLNPLPDGAPLNRLTLAQWLVSPENPLTARVTVNRIWQQYFGQGIVATSEDFGLQGDAPTHPELLDWLATEFVARGWDLKQLHKLIVTSATYRQDARATAELIERDPSNSLYARGPRNRLEAEMLRDQALAIAGLLSRKMHGPSVMPPQPDGVWQVVYSGDAWVTSEGEDRYRRGIYTFWRRTSPYPSMITFDAPSREFCVDRRNRSNTPLQALTLLNDQVYIEAAQALARRMLAVSDTPLEAQLSHGFSLCVAREPTSQEIEKLAALNKSELEHFQQDATAALAMCGGAVEGMDSTQFAAMTVVANVLLNLDETVSK